MSLLRRTYSASSQSNTSSDQEYSTRRVTIKQLLTVYENYQGTFFIEQQPLEKFILVANVYNNQVILSRSRVFYGFDDGSGRISGFKPDTGTGYPTFSPFAYATILGRLMKDSDGSVAVEVSYILPVYDPHEIYFHILHVMFDDVRHQRGNPGREDWLLSQSHDCQIDGLTVALRDTNISGLSELEEDIIACIKNLKEYWETDGDLDSLACGAQIGTVVHELSAYHHDKNAYDFWNSIERLLEIGILRTTIDERHLDFS